MLQGLEEGQVEDELYDFFQPCYKVLLLPAFCHNADAARCVVDSHFQVISVPTHLLCLAARLLHVLPVSASCQTYGTILVTLYLLHYTCTYYTKLITLY
jgi:hypothetical protein